MNMTNNTCCCGGHVGAYGKRNIIKQNKKSWVFDTVG